MKDCKYYKQKRQVSYDNGVTWSDVTPAEYRKGELYESHSIDCDYSKQYLTFVALKDGQFMFSGTSGNSSIQYSLDGGNTWSTLASGSYSPTVTAGNTIKWKGNLTPVYDPNIWASYYGVGRFGGTNDFNVEGNVMSILYSDNYENQTSLSGKPHAFQNLFCTNIEEFPYDANWKIKSVENIILPATTLDEYCYADMFSNCKSITVLPELPATSLADYCYETMFFDCDSLTSIPSDYFKATILAEYCYHAMFSQCNGLTDISNLSEYFSNTTQAKGCYQQMFYDCRYLTTVPVLSATTLAEHCYHGMFEYCTSLTTVPSNMLPATTLSKWCYDGMFMSCTSLTSLPELPATNLSGAVQCYHSMFRNCTSLTTVPSDYLPATNISNADSCYADMFSLCTSLTTAPDLPATSLAEGCYSSMFSDCTSLTTAPDLHASSLRQSCYSGMFYGCTSLNYIKCLATSISAWHCTNVWVNGVSSTGTFVKASSMSGWSSGSNGIPSGWTVQNAT